MQDSESNKLILNKLNIFRKKYKKTKGDFI